jgi:hypothetical protein
MGIEQLPLGETTIKPSEILYDPVNKFRTSQPQALIDTDFEYGTQQTKWENLGLIDNRPYVYTSQTPIAGITAIAFNTGSRTVTVSLPSTAGIAVGTPISVYDTFLSPSNGNFIVEAVTLNTSFTYTAQAVNSTAVQAIFDPNKTAIYLGTIFSGAAIGGAPTAVTIDGTTTKVTITTSVPHGLSLGNEVVVTGITTTGANPPNGSFFVAQILSNTQFVYYANAVPTATLSFGSAAVYVRPQSQFLHRPFDGGVIFSSNGTSNYCSAIRQTRRYFRYQSGKGVQVSSGTILKANFQVDSLSYASSVVTVQTKEQHNIQPGAVVTVTGATDANYNGTFTITNVTGFNTFTYVPVSAPTTTPVGGNIYVSISGWYGCANRLGLFDQQNGVFFEFDGQTLNAVRRASVFQLAGKISVTSGLNTVTQTDAAFPTVFSKQLAIGDYIVIRGASYRVTDIASDTSLTISPSYRGATTTYTIATKTIETRYPQSTWNLDKLDGTGPSGYNIDLTKMQMFYIDYSWYGAGFIRWGMRATNGDVVYCHKVANNNVNSEAWMRSGNMCARYESSTVVPASAITSSVGASDTTINVSSTSGFYPGSVSAPGTLCIRHATYGYEFVNYTGVTATSFTGVTRGQSGNAALGITIAQGSNVGTVGSAANLQIGQRVIGTNIPEGTFISNISGTTLTLSQAVTAANPTVIVPAMGSGTGVAFTYAATSPVVVEQAFPTYASSISHWGTSVIMDGRYDDDKSLLFTYGTSAAVTVAAGATNALLSIRVAPSVDNGVGGVFGSRELVNRMQLILRALDVTLTTASSNLLIVAVLNGVVSSGATWVRPTGGNSSLAQVAEYAAGVTITGGDITGGFFVSTTTSIDLSTVRDLGNSILGGGTGTTSTSNIFPDGPDVLTIMVRNLGAANATLFGRISWTEAQA